MAQKPPRGLSENAQYVLTLIGQGWRLRVAHATGQAAVIDIGIEPGAWRHNQAVEVSSVTVQELLASNHLWKLTEHRIDDRLGWREKGLDGNNADWYCMVM